AGRAVEQSMLLEKVQGQPGQALLLGTIHGGGRPFGVLTAGRTHLHEYNARTIERDDVQFAVRAGVVTSEEAVALALEEAAGRPLRTRAKPAAPPGLPRRCARHETSMARPPYKTEAPARAASFPRWRFRLIQSGMRLARRLRAGALL